jgi:hypothetical protein
MNKLEIESEIIVIFNKNAMMEDGGHEYMIDFDYD